MDRLLERLLKWMTGFPLPKNKSGVNTSFHNAAVGSFGASVSKLSVPAHTAILFFILVLLSFWICAAFFGPLQK